MSINTHPYHHFIPSIVSLYEWAKKLLANLKAVKVCLFLISLAFFWRNKDFLYHVILAKNQIKKPQFQILKVLCSHACWTVNFIMLLNTKLFLVVITWYLCAISGHHCSNHSNRIGSFPLADLSGNLMHFPQFQNPYIDTNLWNLFKIQRNLICSDN